MEHALQRLRTKRDSSEVVLTLEILKAGKRFHTTVSFDSDIRLKHMQDCVMDYNLLMKDFPIKDLLAADSLESVRTAILAIFAHMKKIRSTNYPTDRAVGLVEGVSRDVLSQMLKALSSHQLMVIAYNEFEIVFESAGSVFGCWEEEFERFNTQLRELGKKKRDDTFKFHIKFNLAHKKLQIRLEQMKE